MADFAVTRTVEKVELDANAVLKEAWRLYKRLFTRSLVMGALVFGVLDIVKEAARSGSTGLLAVLLSLVVAVAGTALLQGGLVEIVRGLHVDGDDEASAFDALARAGDRLGKLVAVSLLVGLGVGLGFLLLVIPGLVLATRWAVAVPVAMLEQGTARDAMKRSRAILRGNEWNVFKVLFAVGLLTGLVSLPFTLVGAHQGPFGWWVAATLGSVLTAPYTAHALTVVYYALIQPGQPVVLPPAQQWQSIWDDEDA
ncbi:hypothetical protein [Gaiella sp.]|uniref:hypothetical protein n=1 Tax=Gaiella sp. TaxID=2663207 RepID=UPI002E36E7C6|nr:hypothetical protein [Gaiella sp.]HEX5582152.1 hypothetical protein [Gaiella sp.]